MLHLCSFIFFMVALYLLVTGIYYKKWKMYYSSTPLKISGKILKEILGEVGMKYYSIISSLIFFIIAIMFFYFGLNYQDKKSVDAYLSKFESKSTIEIAREKAIKDGKSSFTYIDDGVTFTEIFEEDPNTSVLLANEIVLIDSKNIDQKLCSELKKITRSPFKDIEFSNDKKTSELDFGLIQISNISDSIKINIKECLIKNKFKEGLIDNWSDGKLKINFTKSKKTNNLILGK